MSETPIRLIVSDLDGTLLNSAHEISPFTAQAVDAAQAQGVLFTVATGKTFRSTPQVIKRFGINIPVICGNGTQVFMPDGTMFHEEPIPFEMALEALAMARAVNFTPIIYTAQGLLAPVRDANVAELIAHHEPEPVIVPDVTAALHNGHKPYKLVLMNQDHAAVAEFQTAITERFEGRAQVLRSGLESLVEVMPFGVNKGTALRVLTERVGVRAAETIAFGDNCNDLAMLQAAGIGVAMGHSPQAVRDGADYVTGTNDEDGVGYALHKFVLRSSAVDV